MPQANSADARYVEVRLANVRLEREGRTILDDVSWTIRPGERWVLAGGNGAGKTQLLKLIAGAVWPSPTGREVRQHSPAPTHMRSREYRWRGELWPGHAGHEDVEDVERDVRSLAPQHLQSSVCALGLSPATAAIYPIEPIVSELP